MNKAEVEAILAKLSPEEREKVIHIIRADDPEDENHPVRKPPTKFSVGQHVEVLADGVKSEAKVIDIKGDADSGFKYVVVSAVEDTVEESALTAIPLPVEAAEKV